MKTLKLSQNSAPLQDRRSQTLILQRFQRPRRPRRHRADTLNGARRLKTAHPKTAGQQTAPNQRKLDTACAPFFTRPFRGAVKTRPRRTQEKEKHGTTQIHHLPMRNHHRHHQPRNNQTLEPPTPSPPMASPLPTHPPHQTPSRMACHLHPAPILVAHPLRHPHPLARRTPVRTPTSFHPATHHRNPTGHLMARRPALLERTTHMHTEIPCGNCDLPVLVTVTDSLTKSDGTPWRVFHGACYKPMKETNK